MLKKLINTILLTNGISSLDEKENERKQDKWAERRKKYGDRPWEDQRPPTGSEKAADADETPKPENP